MTGAENGTSSTSFKISGLAYLVVPLLAVGCVMMMGISVAGYAWTLIVPIAVAWWIHRLRTDVDGQGITSVSTFGVKRVPWHDVDGLRFPKWGSAYVVLTDETSVRLPAVGFADLPVISKVSGGRVPDPFAAEREARLAAD